VVRVWVCFDRSLTGACSSTPAGLLAQLACLSSSSCHAEVRRVIRRAAEAQRWPPGSSVRSRPLVEPYRLRRWKPRGSPQSISFFSCARPGRSKDANSPVSDDLVRSWVAALPGETDIALVSLLGRKPDGTSEYSFYSFCGGFEIPSERSGRLSFQEWLDRWHRDRRVRVVDYPTRDFNRVPTSTLATIREDVNSFLAAGQTVILVDSGGLTRTGEVCRYLDFVEDGMPWPNQPRLTKRLS
jgi:hypothetical protein